MGKKGWIRTRRLKTLAASTGKVFTGSSMPVLLLVAGLSALPGLAGQTGIARAGEIRQAGANMNCTCRFFGTDYKLGDMICLRGPNGPRMARCSMNLNNTTWKTLERSCPTSLRQAPHTIATLAGLPAAH
ncbi:hypothetical protein [Stappia sp. MMSF_3263]|uniref:hypothetical protein n=1 Tax=Stappia sp. MMSF_3263 TaxID=3046693 RepID=UPI00273F8102|nr:hypothetical protein [Stappia sp. MMSF_3263]